MMIDIRPAADRTANVVTSVADEQLDLPTPCPDARLGDLIDHVGSLSRAFLASARKQAGDRAGPPPSPSAANLAPGWRDQISGDLRAVADAWREPEAWEGFTNAGGIELPAEVAGLVVLDELVVHGWDIAVASGQPYQPAAPEVDAAMSFVGSFDAPRDGSLFGPVVPVADTAPPLDRLIGLTGRDPHWQPPT
jgi:uncharacterized protein (TIGR03086 family)